MALLFALALVMATASAAEIAPLPGPDVMTPTEVGVRMTPGIARALARLIAREPLKREYGLDEPAQAEAADRIARRVMALAHKDQTQAQVFGEFLLESWAEHQNDDAIIEKIGARCSDLFSPMLPDIRATAMAVIEDVRPLVPPDKQMRYARDTIAATMFFDAMGAKMNRWAEGGARAGENPLDAYDDVRDGRRSSHDGSTEAVDYARNRIEQVTRNWPDCVDQAIKAYGFDAAQKASAESILVELQQRAEAVMTEAWRSKANVTLAKFWTACYTSKAFDQPWFWKLRQEREDLFEPIESMTRELQTRLERLGTQRQREAAMAAFVKELNKAGLSP